MHEVVVGVAGAVVDDDVDDSEVVVDVVVDDSEVLDVVVDDSEVLVDVVVDDFVPPQLLSQSMFQ